MSNWIKCNGRPPHTVGDHVLVTIKWSDADLEVCEMCPLDFDNYNIIAYMPMPHPYQGKEDDEQ